MERKRKLPQISWVQPKYQVYDKLLFPSKISIDIHDLHYREDYFYDDPGSSFIYQINKNTYRICFAFKAPNEAVYDEQDPETGYYMEDPPFDKECSDIKLPEPILQYICVKEAGFSGDVLIAETKNYFVDFLNFILLSKKNLNIQRKIAIIPNSRFIVLRGNEIPRGVNLRAIPLDRKRDLNLKSNLNFPTHRQWANILKKALRSGNTSEANIKRLAGNFCIPLGDTREWYYKYLGLDIK